ncbi:uncharacterized protein LOC130671256 [Microplitis mediator]|uniref:uncharacterized protein LOC130671256 n=1 Tax=Microplitis mediator TaxID=375433 RepID=UPI0025575EA9|nr:uncharacterized protein LOC130671256 [Microplitis mediator]
MFKTKKYKKIWDNLSEKLNNIDLLLTDNNNDDELINLVNNLSKLSQELKSVLLKNNNDKIKLIELFDDFIYETKSRENSKKNLSLNMEEFKNNLKTEFKIIETNESRDLIKKSRDLLSYFDGINDNFELNIYEVRKIETSLIEIIEELKKYLSDLLSPGMREKIYLCATQLIVTFKLLIDLINEQTEIGTQICGTRIYLFNCFSVCLQIIIDTIEGDYSADDEEIDEEENHFIHKMDLALDLVNKMADMKHEMAEPNDKPGDLNLNYCKEKNELIEELWSVLEDIFSHTMAIAQVCSPEQFNLMTGISKTVICEFDNWKREFLKEKRDRALFSLFGNTFMDAMYRLERAVNVAMLQLVMEVFSEPFSALKKLVKICGNSLKKECRRKEDLEKAIEEFDLITDKALQIGLYAAASCGNTTRALRIRNHMASLESLDLELVAAITSFYLEPSSELRSAVKLLTTQWQNEMNNLHKSVDLILDPSAYCQVVLEDLQERVQSISDGFENHQTVTQSQIKIIVYRACALASQITTAIDDIGSNVIDKQTVMTIRELKAAIYETDAASKTLLTPTSTLPQQLRVIKRCELLLSVIKRLQPALEIINSKITSSLMSNSDNSLSNDSKSFIKTPYTVKNYKSTVTIQFDDQDKIDPCDLSCLIPYIERGKTMRSEFSVLYKNNWADDDDFEDCDGEGRGKIFFKSLARRWGGESKRRSRKKIVSKNFDENLLEKNEKKNPEDGLENFEKEFKEKILINDGKEKIKVENFDNNGIEKLKNENFEKGRHEDNFEEKIKDENFDKNYKEKNHENKNLSKNNKEIFTSANNKSKLKLRRNLNNIRLHLFNRDDFSINSINNDSNEEEFKEISLDLTGILENISGISMADSETSNGTKSIGGQDVSSVIDKEMDYCRETRDSGDSNFANDGAGDAGSISGISSIDTPERIKGIKKIDKKIEILQRRVNSK